MRTLTDDLIALLKDRLQAGSSGFRSRLEVDLRSSATVDPTVEPFANQSGGGAATLNVALTTTPEAGDLLVGFAGAAHTGGSGVGDYYTWPAGWVTIAEGFHPSWASAGSDTLGMFSMAFKIAEGDETSIAVVAHVAGLQSNHALIVNYGIKPDPGELAAPGAWRYPTSPTHASSAALPAIDVNAGVQGTYLQIAGLQRRPDWPLVPPSGWEVTSTGGEFDIEYTLAHNVVAVVGSATLGGTFAVSGSPGTGAYPDPLWTLAHAVFKVPADNAGEVVPVAISGEITVSIDKSLRMTADEATVEIENEDLRYGWGSRQLIPTNTRIRIYQWYGDPANEVKTFTGVVDNAHNQRDPIRLVLTCRDMFAVLLDQTFGATAPQDAGETGAVRTAANGVYLDMEVSDIVADILDRAGWPSADRVIAPTSYTVEQYTLNDGDSWAACILGDDRLAGLVGYDAWADEDGVFHFEPTYTAGALTDPPTPAYTFRSGEDITELEDETDQYDLRTRVKVRGPLTTQVLTDEWRELWRTSKFGRPVGLWHDPSDAANLRVLDRGTKRLYKLRQSDRKVLSSVSISAICPHPLGLSGDPADSSVYWILDAPWIDGGSGGNRARKVRKSDNHVLLTLALPTGTISALKVSANYLYFTRLDTDRFYRASKTTGTVAATYSHTYGGHTQANPSGLMIDGTTISVFWANGGTTARFLVCEESAPGTVTDVTKTAGTTLHGGEMDTVTHTECYGDSDSLGLVAKFSLVAKTSRTDEVYAEVIDADLEDELGTVAQLEPRAHDAHPLLADHPFEIRRDTLDVTVVASLAQATETAGRRLDKLSKRRRVVDAGIIGNPGLQKTDPVRVEDAVTGVGRTFTVDTYRSSMSADGTYLGTLALIPLDSVDDTPTDDGSATE